MEEGAHRDEVSAGPSQATEDHLNQPHAVSNQIVRIPYGSPLIEGCASSSRQLWIRHWILCASAR